MTASSIAERYTEHEDRPYSRNLRRKLDATRVDPGMLGTRAQEPETFSLFNDGVTVLRDGLEQDRPGARPAWTAQA
ncbi:MULTISPECIES: hypothetical protein [Streptomyces]|uniref:hypothetical protein n=1 Tax=Streptomyces TaxID=1883 RepID=UPI0004BD8011|nr:MULTISPECIES: hypothetical protein [Streptomyces]MCW8217203.1 hypothetical protein [Streptomyces griseolus]